MSVLFFLVMVLSSISPVLFPTGLLSRGRRGLYILCIGLSLLALIISLMVEVKVNISMFLLAPLCLSSIFAVCIVIKTGGRAKIYLSAAIAGVAVFAAVFSQADIRLYFVQAFSYLVMIMIMKGKTRSIAHTALHALVIPLSFTAVFCVISFSAVPSWLAMMAFTLPFFVALTSPLLTLKPQR